MNIELLRDNLEKLGYITHVFMTKKEAADYLAETYKDTTIGIGGSMTVEEMNVYERLQEHNEVYWHQKDRTAEIMEKAARAKVYISSVNGVSMDGQIINIDGTGNRVSSTYYGHEKVVLIFGINKIRDTYEEALDRARNIAAVKNAIRLKKNTPCVKTGKCTDCASPERICRGLSVFWSKPKCCEYEVIIVNDELGY